MFKVSLDMEMTLEQLNWLVKPFRDEPYTTFSVDYEIKVAEHFFNISPEKYNKLCLPTVNSGTMSGEEIKKELLDLKQLIKQEMDVLDINDMYLEVHFKAELLAYPLY